ncbi:PREDICTED: pentatricopeptide repeat-containing protein At2g48000-like [Camelina sativa]|uniref:Pentatricopeptide repeat-containing protein At2g48000-like n=1 Tax=Camelina sativa TaxID=90675 RepID=A0ABM0YY88_CAMSA|nr:PREDICTED: pentatricopeptide repeat-containing protein At2g48000-like [Camelina sativa]
MKKRMWRISLITQISDLLCLSRGSSSTLKTLTPFSFTLFRSPIHPPFHQSSDFTSGLKHQLLRYSHDSDKVATVLESTKIQGAAFVELLRQLRPWPVLSQVVFDWRRNKALRDGVPMTADEYAKGITISGRLKNVDMALSLFDESAKTTSVYNALMGAYMWNGLADQCKQLFLDFEAQEEHSTPSVSTYNILISVYGRLIMVDRMEAVFLQLQQLKILPDSSTYNNLIAGYIYAWSWDKMESTFQIMKHGGLVKPTLATYLLMLRGYANSGNLVRMEEMYQAVKRHVDRNEIKLLESMICAYYRSSDKDRIRKIKTLCKLIPKKSYKPWLYVLLIQLYGQDDNLHAMENFIDQAITKGLQIETDGIMRSIVASYFRCNAVDKLAKFVQRAHSAGWRMSRSMFHGLMLMYGTQKRFKEMENALSEMESFNISRSKKTLCILHRVYATHGQEHKVNQVAGMMLKHGHDFPRELPEAITVPASGTM